jgi:hypothetical protein
VEAVDLVEAKSEEYDRPGAIGIRSNDQMGHRMDGWYVVVTAWQGVFSVDLVLHQVIEVYFCGLVYWVLSGQDLWLFTTV